jgi:hypothetical protein
VELRWHRVGSRDRVAVARLFVGADADLKQVVGTFACSPEAMNLLDRMLREGAAIVDTVTYVGQELINGEAEAW